MKFYVSILFATMLFLAGCSSGESKPSKPPKPLTEAEKTVAESTQQFAFDLYRQLAAEAKADENLFFSPLGVHTVLAMTATGAEAETRQQMLAALHLASLDPAEKSAYTGLLQCLNSEGAKSHVKLANHVWIDKGYPVHAAFSQSMRDDFLAGITPVNFSDEPAAAKMINRWAEKQTHGKITNPVSPADIETDTRLLLANAVYFSGQWDNCFTTSKTEEHVFRTAEPRENPPKIPLMAMNEPYPYYKGDTFQALALPYRDGQTEMIVILPDEPDGLPEVEKRLTAAFFDEIAQNFTRSVVVLRMAKFKLEESYQLKDALTKLGITDAFSGDKADFTGITGRPRLCVTAVFQKTYLEVDEKGTTAAAFGGAWAVDSAAEIPPEFITDRPFIFAIYDRHTATVLFLGRFVSP